MSTDRLTIEQTIYPKGEYWPEKVGDFVGMINTMLLEIPFDHRREAEISFMSVMNYGCDEIEMSISYRREESDKEYQDRMEQEIRAHKSNEDHELEEYNRLKEKFEK